MKILLVEDHAPTREQVAYQIGRENDMEVVAQVGTAEEAIEAVRRLEPDIVIMDILLPLMNGIEATRTILSDRPETRIIALSNYSGPILVQTILDAGGLGFVRKNRAFEELIPAIRAVGNGKHYIGEKTGGPNLPE